MFRKFDPGIAVNKKMCGVLKNRKLFPRQGVTLPPSLAPPRGLEDLMFGPFVPCAPERSLTPHVLSRGESMPPGGGRFWPRAPGVFCGARRSRQRTSGSLHRTTLRVHRVQRGSVVVPGPPPSLQHRLLQPATSLQSAPSCRQLIADLSEGVPLRREKALFPGPRRNRGWNP